MKALLAAAILAALPSFPRYAPDPSAAGPARLEGETWTIETPHAAARLERLDDDARWDYLRRTTGAATDPFAVPGARTRPFLTFRLVLENRGPGTLVFESQTCRLIARDKSTRYPLDMPSIESAYAVHDTEMPPAYAAVRKALFDGTAFVSAGERIEGLLVFRALPDRARGFTVDARWTTGDGAGGGLLAPYRKVKE